jgi:dTMP kinase
VATRRKKGLFITFEGIEGVGKSTQAEFLRREFQRSGREVVRTREPGGTGVGDRIRDLLLFRQTGHSICERTELLLMFCARQQHLSEVIGPALRAGKVVISDRFTDSTYAYQGGGHRIPSTEIRILERWVQKGLKPDLTIVLDAPVRVGLERAGFRADDPEYPDRDWFESRTVPFFRRVRRRYLEIAKAEPRRVKVVDANRSIERVRRDIRTLVERRKWI